MTTPTVFVSYSHQDESWTDRLLPHLRTLETAGVDLRVWHDRRIDGGDKWYPEILEAMANAASAILLVSQHFLASRFCVQEEVPALLKRQEEEGMLLIPVLLRPCPWKAHRWLKDRQMIPRDGKCVSVDFAGDAADTVFAAVANQVLDHFERLATRRPLPASVRQLATRHALVVDASIVAPAPAVPWPSLPAEHVDLTRLPETGSELFGRDAELALLDQAWTSQDSLQHVRVLAFTASGGVGKSTVVNRWLDEMRSEHYRGAERVFAWSFYSQGVRDEGAPSGDTFIASALRFFGDKDPTTGSPWDKGARLAALVGHRRALLILDGLEPLQSPYAFERGKVRDPAVATLLGGLARQSAGLCLVTTREPLPELATRPGVTVRDLEQISVQAGRALLRTARVVGTDVELAGLAERFGPHALAVSLLGVYLREQPGRGIGPAADLEHLPGERPIDRVLTGFERWLGEGPERETLHLLGFFDRPADSGCMAALRATPSIRGLTEQLVGLDEAQWQRVLGRLAQLRLVHVRRIRAGLELIDAHPLVREHFAAWLRGRPAWKDGHRRLYRHLCESTADGARPSLEDLQPLYQAVAHGCHAGLQAEACDEVYVRRILKGTGARGFYSSKQLGAIGPDLGAVACFFEEPWRRVSSVLSDDTQSWLLNEAASRLIALGRLAEAGEPMRAGLAMDIAQKAWTNAAIQACNLSDLDLTLGDVATALVDAEGAVRYADLSGDESWRCVARASHAGTLHGAGRHGEARALFDEAETMQARTQRHELLYSVPGFRYCELRSAAVERAAWRHMLALNIDAQESLLASCRTLSERAKRTLDLAKRRDMSLLTLALDHLTLARTALYGAVLGQSSLASCQGFIRSAVEGLRRAGRQDYLPLCLLTRAWLRALTGKRTGPDSARADIDEAWEIAERGPMPLFLTEVHLYRARLFHFDPLYPSTDVDGNPRGPRDDIAAARRLIEKHGYWRRKEELEDAEAAAARW